MKKVCLIGCNGGIGNAICDSLKENGYYIIGIDKQDTQICSGVNEFYAVDLNSTDQILKVCKSIKYKEELWGLIFSAGVYPIRKFEDYSLELWEEVMNVNLKSCFLISKELSSHISIGGRIVFISSGASYLGSQDIGYSVSKFGLHGLGKGLAKHFGKRILVNTISPGVIETKMSERMDEFRKRSTLDNTLLKRLGQPNELTAAVIFLLDINNSYMTGATIDINGGLYSR
jgi:3-oxoacyl-[acyl-carrier protein] reductase